jgi:hypothetical protein
MQNRSVRGVRVAKRRAAVVDKAVHVLQREPTRIEWVNAKYSILAPEPAALLVTIGIWLKSQARWSNNWRAQHGRSHQLRGYVMHAFARIDLESLLRALGGAPNAIRFVRLAPRSLDDDNLRTAFKPIRDQVCCWLAGDNTLTAKANDGKRSGYTFDYGQQPQHAYGVRIEVRRTYA